MHFYADDNRVAEDVKALKNNDVKQFLSLIVESGFSSWMLCQNCYTTKHVHEQGIPVALAISEKILKNKGAWRVHGGGFAGTIQAFVPDSVLDKYVSTMQSVFGKDAVHQLFIRKAGSVKLTF
jgi:galactokinase